MAKLRLIEPLPLQRIQSLLNDNNVLVQPIVVEYEDYIVRNAISATDAPLQFSWWKGTQSEPLFFSLSTRGSKESKANPGAHLLIGTKADDRIVGYLLSQMPQDDEFVYLSFRIGNGEGGNNRWFGRGRHPRDQRPDEAMRQLHGKLPYTWKLTFPTPMPPHPTLPGDWLLLARLPLVELDPSAAPTQRSALKTLILENLAQAFVIAEKLRDESFRDESFKDTKTGGTDDAKDSSSSSKMSTPLNQILYGPPGTGKTHHTKARAVGIIENLTDEEVADAYSREEIRDLFEGYRKAGQVEFVTFHQAFGYEDFVEGIKPNLTADDDVKYRIETGLFRRMADAAHASWQRVHASATPQTEAAALPFPLVYGGYLADLQARLAASADHTVTIPTVGNYSAVVSAAADSGVISIRHGNAPLQYNVRAAWTQAVYQRYGQAADIVPMNKKMLEIGGPNATLQWAIFNDLKKYEAEQLSELL